MTSITDLIPRDVLHRFLRREMARRRVLIVAVSGAHGSGYPHRESPLELKGIHVDHTEAVVALVPPPRAHNFVGEFESLRVDFSSVEIGPALRELLKGDGAVLERILAKRQLVGGRDVATLQRITRKVICKRYASYYRSFSRGLLRDYEEGERRSVAHLLRAYRTALTGVHLLRTGKVALDLMTLARAYGFGDLAELVKRSRGVAGAKVAADDPWIARLVRLQALLEESIELSELPNDPVDPAALEEYLLDMRRRYFDAMTVQD